MGILAYNYYGCLFVWWNQLLRDSLKVVSENENPSCSAKSCPSCPFNRDNYYKAGDYMNKRKPIT